MKIYLAYRSAYYPNSRFIKSFEEETILGWFQKHWEVFTKEDAEETQEYISVLGADIYGFPIWQDDDEPIPTKPNSFEELKTILERDIYSNEILGDEKCLKVLTDDDEIELAWFIFTEDYKQANWDDLSLWFYDEIPTEFGENGLILPAEEQILPKGDGIGCTYFISCSIYDGANLEDLEGVYKLENVRLPNFLNHIKENELGADDEEEYSSPLNEINFMKYIAQKSDSSNLDEVVSICSKLPITELDETNFNDLTYEELLEFDFRNTPEKSKVYFSEHFCEICINSVGEFYNYWVLFDDLWIEKNPSLATSFLRFGETWEI